MARQCPARLPSLPRPLTTRGWRACSSGSTASDLGAEDTTAPYSRAWDTRTVPNGTHVLTAVARDIAGNQTTSSPITVTVSNTTPPPATGLVAAYAFSEGSGTTTSDRSGKGNTGTLAGATWTTAGQAGAGLILRWRQ